MVDIRRYAPVFAFVLMLSGCGSDGNADAIGGPAQGGSGGESGSSGAGGASTGGTGGTSNTGGTGGTANTGGTGGSGGSSGSTGGEGGDAGFGGSSGSSGGGGVVVLWEGAQCNISGTLAQSEDHLYFGANNGLHRIGKDGSNLTPLAGSSVGAVAVSSSRVFWVDKHGESIHSANMDGTDQKVVAPSPEGKWVHRLQADDNHVYWSGGESTSGGLNRAPVGGGTKTQLSTSGWMTFALQDGTIFGLCTGQLMRINADGTGQTVLTSMADGAWGLFVDSQIFWGTMCNGGSDCNKSWRAEKDGSGVTTVNSFGASGAYVADADSLYMPFNGQIFRMKRDGTLPETLVTGVWDVRAECLLADDDFLYWFDGDGKCKSRLVRFPK